MDNFFSKPPKVEACVRRLLADPNFKPKTKGQTKESAAWAVCQATLNKAMDDIVEAIIILKHFEDNPVIAKDYSTVSSDTLNPNGDPLQPELVGIDDINSIDTTKPDTSSLTSDFLSEEMSQAQDPFQSVNLSQIQEAPNILSYDNPSSSVTEDVTNVKDNPLI